MTAETPLTISVDVTNNGEVEGEEIVQLYIQDVVGEVVRPLKELKGFDKGDVATWRNKNNLFHHFRGAVALSS